MRAIEDLQVLRARTADFHPCFLESQKRHLIKLDKLIYALYAWGLSTRDISPTLEIFLESNYRVVRQDMISTPRTWL
jgi:transposase-like protein